MSNAPQRSRLTRGGTAQREPQGMVSTRRQSAPRPYPDVSPRAVRHGRRERASTVLPTRETRAVTETTSPPPSPMTRAAAASAALGTVRGPQAASSPRVARRPADASGVARGPQAASSPRVARRPVVESGVARAGPRAASSPRVARRPATASGVARGPQAANLAQHFVQEAIPLQAAGTRAAARQREQPAGQEEEVNTLAKMSDRFTIQKCVKEHVFPKQKFVDMHADLDFSNNPMSICRFMAGILKVEEHSIERWWETTKITVKLELMRHRNNVIKKIRTAFEDKVLSNTPRTFRIEDFIGLRNDECRENYIELLDSMLQSVVGYAKVKENRCEKMLSEWFTITDEAFLILCIEAYWKKWYYDWMVKRAGPPSEPPRPEQIQPMYTGKAKGTKRSWSKDGLERFNNIALLVFNDRKERGEEFDHDFLEAMKMEYEPQHGTANPDSLEDLIDTAPTIVYNEFNMQLLIAHAQRTEQEPAGADNDDLERVPV